MRNSDNIQSSEENMLTTLCDHPLVYQEQTKCGHLPYNWIINKGISDAEAVSHRKNLNENDLISESLYYADSVFNLPRNLSRKITRNAKQNNRDLYDRIIKIIDVMKSGDILDFDQNLEIRKKIIIINSMKGRWDVRDDLESFKKLLI